MLKVGDIINWQKINQVVIRYNFWFFIFKIFFLLCLITFFVLFFSVTNVILYYFLIIISLILVVLLYYFLIEKELGFLYITDKSILFLDKENFSKRKFVEINFSQINQIKVLVSWFSQNFLNYWTMKIYFYDWTTKDITFVPDVINLTSKIFKKS